ncbi:hypothetical protein HY627_00210 [Candidatus Uhrbacteria bacterium]|nr:hypothetical protein [Candidatus Uhrbacteria bacterium]
MKPEHISNNDSLAVPHAESFGESLWSTVKSELDLVSSYLDPFDPSTKAKTYALLEAVGAPQFVHLFESNFAAAPFDCTKSQHVQILKGIARGASDWVVKKYEKDAMHLDLTRDADVSLAAILARDGQADWVLERMHGATLQLKYVSDLLCALCEVGRAKQVTILLDEYDSSEFDFKNEHIVDVFLALASSGEARWVREMLKDTLRIDDDPDGFHCTMVKHDAGEAERIMHEVESTAAGLWIHRVSLLKSLAEEGYGVRVAQCVNPQEIDFSQHDQVALIEAIARNGDAAWVVKHFGDHPGNPYVARIIQEAIYQEAFDRGEAFPGISSGEQKDFLENRDFSDDQKRAKFRGQFFKSLEMLQFACELEEDVMEDLKGKIEETLRALPAIAIPLIRLGADNGFFSPAMIKMLDSFRGARKAFSFKIDKSGSDLFIMGKPIDADHAYEITLINDVLPESAATWAAAAKAGVPVAPILEGPMRRSEHVSRVYSRYCGLTLNGMRGLQPPAALSALLSKRRREIDTQLREKKIVHGHFHEENLTIEFVEKEWLDEQLKKGLTINTLPGSSKHIMFDPVAFCANPSKYDVVMRAIDWDQSRSGE